MTKSITIKALFFTVLALFFYSCNSKTTYSDFSVEIEAVMEQNDSIHTFYTSSGDINFNEKKSFWTQFKGNTKNQKITINFPKDTVPKQLRFDFGKNKKLEEVVLNKLTILYKSKSIILKGKEIYRLFRVDQSNTNLDYELGVLKRKDSAQINGPSLYPNGDFLKQKLEKLTTSTSN